MNCYVNLILISIQNHINQDLIVVGLWALKIVLNLFYSGLIKFLSFGNLMLLSLRS